MALLRTSDGHEAELSAGRETVLGSSADADLQIRAEFGLAARHLMIGKGPETEAWWIEPIDDESVCTVNGSPLQSRRPLKDGAYVRAAGFEFRFLDESTRSGNAIVRTVTVAEALSLPQDERESDADGNPLRHAKALAAAQGRERRAGRWNLVAALFFVVIAAAAIGGFIAAAKSKNAKTSPATSSVSQLP